ncbi:MAG: hypothetical protein LCH81_00895 [Bacteroidetes bacterium]|nr:hypothetical protein [Bacteroidota bacterium]
MGAPKILSLSSVQVDDYPFYFFDSNIWIAYLKQHGGYSVERYETQYVNFFEDVIALHAGNTKKPPRYLPKIVMPALVMTETINALIRHECDQFYTANSLLPNSGKVSFKRDYRNTEDYRKKLRKIVSDIQAVRDYIELWEDHLTKIPILDTFSSNPDFDFNDYFYSLLFRNTQIPIVTNDTDYAMFPDITIITSHPKLLRTGALFN